MSLNELRKRLSRRRDQLRRMQVTVLAGGGSSEREVSLVSGRAVAGALAAEGYSAELLNVGRDNMSFSLESGGSSESAALDVGGEEAESTAELQRVLGRGVVQYLRQAQLIFTTMHGTCGEDGVWQGVLELLGLPFVSADVRGSALAMDKLVSKRLFSQLEIPTPEYWVERPGRTCRADVPASAADLVAKPSAQGSSVGIAMVKNDDAGWEVIRQRAQEFGTVLVEKRIDGRELTAGIIGHSGQAVVLPLVEIKPVSREFYDYTAKYTKGETQYICPADIDEGTAELVRRHALLIYDEFGLAPYARVDCILDSQDTPWFLEANTLPGFTELSLVPQAAAAAGVGFAELLELLILVAVERWEEARGSGPR